MADQDAQIDGPYEAVAGVVALTVEGVVGDVADQEQGRENKRCDHRLAMGGDAPRPMNVKPMSRALALRPLSRALRAGRKVSCLLAASGAGVNVDQPEKKQGSDRR